MHLSKPVALKSSFTMIGLISWMSVCLLVAGMSSELSSSQSHLWICSGLLGLISAVGLAQVARSEKAAQRKLYDAYVAEARTDALTELANRRAFEDDIQNLTSLAQREGSDLSLMLIDVDRFKPLNDNFGHQAGDFMLRSVASLLRDAIRSNDFVARFGGEEFTVILPNTCSDEAIVMAEKIRNTVRDYSAKYRDDTLKVTVSIGVTQWCADDDVRSLIERADNALYAAKKQGRDSCCLHDNSSCQVAPQSTLRLHATASDASHMTA